MGRWADCGISKTFVGVILLWADCGISKTFVGVILLPLVGNAAEHMTA